MPQLAPILWLSLLLVFWLTFIFYGVFKWFDSSKKYLSFSPSFFSSPSTMLKW